MSDSNTPKNYLPIQVPENLPEEEVKALMIHIESGKPNLSKVRADSIATVYNLGYSCQWIHQNICPELTLGSIVHAKLSHQWDSIKEEFDRNIKNNYVNIADSVKAEVVQFLSEIITATHVRWKMDILKYLANPTREDAPACLPNSLGTYRNVVSFMEELAHPDNAGSKKSGSSGSLPGGFSQLVSVQINNAPKEKEEQAPVLKDVHEVKNNRAAELLRKKASEIKNGK